MGKFSAVEQLERLDPFHVETDPFTASVTWNKLKAGQSEDHLRQVEQHLLDEFRVTGTLGLSDGSGFTRATKTRPLLPVLQWMSGMKQRIFAHGAAIGGRSTGSWITDNTAEIYPQRKPEMVALQMVGAQRDIADSRVMPTGILIDSGNFFVIGANTYGAATAEYIAEELAGPDEILLTSAAVAQLGSRTLPLVEIERGGQRLFRLDYQEARLTPPLSAVTDRRFPAPYPSDLFSYLLGRESGDVGNDTTLLARYGRTETVAVVRTELPSNPYVFDHLTAMTIITSTLEKLAEQAGVELHARVNSEIVVSTRKDESAVVEFARASTEALTELGYPSTVGVARGPIIDLRATAYGEAVNRAAKIADLGKWGETLVDESVPLPLRLRQRGQPFSAERSGVHLTGIALLVR